MVRINGPSSTPAPAPLSTRLSKRTTLREKPGVLTLATLFATVSSARWFARRPLAAVLRA